MISETFGVSCGTIYLLRTGRTAQWRHITVEVLGVVPIDRKHLADNQLIDML